MMLCRPELLYYGGEFRPGLALVIGDDGRVAQIRAASERADCEVVDFPGKALLPGFVNAHSHAFQRLIRGRCESRASNGDNFWSWRESMYRAAAQLDPEDIYRVARMVFLEMALAGVTSVGEFHYLHKTPDGKPYDDPNLLSKKVIAAALSVGVRIVLLRTAYQRSGFEVASHPVQARFFESSREFLSNTEALLAEFPRSDQVQIGIAPHSIRAAPIDALGEMIAWARGKMFPIHMHVAEQPAEIAACEREYNCSPLILFDRHNLLGSDFTAVHAIHVSANELDLLAAKHGMICSCPTTERNLGDAIFAADEAARRGIPIALGTDSQIQIDPLEDARELDYHLRLTYKQRVILDQIELDQIGNHDLSVRLFECATTNGARSLMIAGGELAPDNPADFFTVNLSDPCIGGGSADGLLPLIVFSLNRAAIRDVAVCGKLIVRNGVHARQREIVSQYQQVCRKVWPI